jgi:hypothetical protein
MPAGRIVAAGELAEIALRRNKEILILSPVVLPRDDADDGAGHGYSMA